MLTLCQWGGESPRPATALGVPQLGALRGSERSGMTKTNLNTTNIITAKSLTIRITNGINRVGRVGRNNKNTL